MCELTGWYDSNNVENGLKHLTIQTKRPLKAGRAIGPFVTVCSVLLSSWIESPRMHEYVNSAGDLTYMMLKHPTIQIKRHLKAWRAIASLATMCSGLLHRWVDLPRDHECVN